MNAVVGILLVAALAVCVGYAASERRWQRSFRRKVQSNRRDRLVERFRRQFEDWSVN